MYYRCSSKLGEGCSTGVVVFKLQIILYYCMEKDLVCNCGAECWNRGFSICSGDLLVSEDSGYFIHYCTKHGHPDDF